MDEGCTAPEQKCGFCLRTAAGVCQYGITRCDTFHFPMKPFGSLTFEVFIAKRFGCLTYYREPLRDINIFRLIALEE